MLARYEDRRARRTAPSAPRPVPCLPRAAGCGVTTDGLTRRFVFLRALRWLRWARPPLPRHHAGGARTVDRRDRRGVRGPQRGDIVLEVPSGALADFAGRRRVLLAGAALTAVSLLIFAVAQSVAAFAASVALLATAARSSRARSRPGTWTRCGCSTPPPRSATGCPRRGRGGRGDGRGQPDRGWARHAGGGPAAARSPATGSPRSPARSPRSATSWPSRRLWTSATGARAGRRAEPVAAGWRRSSRPLGPS